MHQINNGSDTALQVKQVANDNATREITGFDQASVVGSVSGAQNRGVIGRRALKDLICAMYLLFFVENVLAINLRECNLYS
jgi:hypothetical protein